MDASTLSRLAEVGLVRLPPDELEALLDWCLDHAENTGDARFGALDRGLRPVLALFEAQDESGGVSSALVGELDAVIRRELPGVLSAPTALEGSLLARSLRRELVIASGRQRS